MIGRSFAAKDVHDQIRAAVVDLFEIMELDPTVDIEKVHINVFNYWHEEFFFSL